MNYYTDFANALIGLKLGAEITRSSWSGEKSLKIIDVKEIDPFIGYYYNGLFGTEIKVWYPSSEDLLAKDWIVEDITQKFRVEFKKWLVDNNLTASKFAQKCGVSAAYISSIMLGKKPINTSVVELFKKGGYEI